MHSQLLLAGRRDLADLCAFVQQYPRLFVLSGAGISTDSGIPGYRDADGQWRRTPPVLLQDFLASEPVRQRYWARSMAGWPTIANARPNMAHDALARLDAAGRLQRLVTQNVDGLHQRAGSSRVIELHGNLEAVVCLGCGALHSRAWIQRTLESLNPEFQAATATTAADGDADIVSPLPSIVGIAAASSRRAVSRTVLSRWPT